MNDRQAAAVTESEAQRAWARVRSNLRESAGARLFEQWLKPMELIEDGDPDSIRLGLPSAFMTNWVRNHYADRLLLEFRALLPDVRGVSIETRVAAPAALTLAAEPVAPAVAAMPAPVASPTAAPASPAAERPSLDARFTFDRFVVDAANRVAFNAARALAEPGVPRFSPLFLHSGTGQGKTHLMHAIGHAFLARHPDATVLCMSAERFMFDFVAAMRARDTHSFKQRLRGADLLLIDD
ncbi:MAG: DnaA ATPase domain-containing protein, partial [Sphingomonas sp.]